MTDLEQSLRRDMRDAWRADHPGSRRAVKTFLTPADKRRRREEHAARLNSAREELETCEGMREWIRSRVLNPHLSPLNAALAAMQCPGAVIGTAAYWHREGSKVNAGEEASAYITAPGFWPKPAFTAAQTNSSLAELELGTPARGLAEELARAHRAAVEELGRKDAFARLLERVPAPADIELGEDRTPARSDSIPF